MRWRNALTVVALVGSMTLLSGCVTCNPCCGGKGGNPTGGGGGSAGGPWLKPGVVRVKRGSSVIAYMSRDPNNAQQQNWVVNGGEPWPLQVAINGTLTFEYLNANDHTAAQLCAHQMYGGTLTNPKQWVLVFDSWGGASCPP